MRWSLWQAGYSSPYSVTPLGRIKNKIIAIELIFNNKNSMINWRLREAYDLCSESFFVKAGSWASVCEYWLCKHKPALSNYMNSALNFNFFPLARISVYKLNHIILSKYVTTDQRTTKTQECFNTINKEETKTPKN